MIANLGTVFESSGDVRTAQGWGGVWARLPDAAWMVKREGKTLTARNWKTLLNDPHMQAIAFCLMSQILGDGLWFRSTWGGDLPQTDAVRLQRRRINRAVAEGSAGTRLDAGNMLTRPDLEAQLLLAGFFGGNGWAVRTWNPDRPGCDGRASCWRVVDADRVETPPNATDTINGVRYRGQVARSIFVRRFDPTTTTGYAFSRRDYDQVDLFDRDGFRQVIHYAPFRWRADSDLGIPALASGLVLAHQLRELLKSHVSGKRLQASHPIAVEVPNPEAAAAAYQAAVEAGEANEDAQMLFVPKGSGAKFTTAAYQGSDLGAVVTVYLRALCAALGYPWQFVLCQLTDANMASAQAALDQAERTTGIYQRQWLEQAGRHLDGSIIREEWARGTLGEVPLDAELFRGEWQRPRRADANRLRTRQAALLALKLGFSPSTIHDELGSDFESEQERLAEDRGVSQRTGNTFPPDGASTNAERVDPDDEPHANDDPEKGEDDPSKPAGQPAQEAAA
jgi:hypothetical protein